MSDTEKTSGILSCPFCGGEAECYRSESKINPSRSVFGVECWNDNCPFNTKYERETDAIEVWNRRSISAPVSNTSVEDGGQVAKADADTFQSRIEPWMDACFGPEISAYKIERNHRFLEEALELVQSNGCTQSEAHQLVDYVYGRDVGEINQEVGGVMVTLAALCLANG